MLYTRLTGAHDVTVMAHGEETSRRHNDRHRRRGHRRDAGGAVPLERIMRHLLPPALCEGGPEDWLGVRDGIRLVLVEPLDPDVLAARREVVLANRRARKAAKPAYVNTDASWRNGLAGLAYVGALGTRVELVVCGDDHEGEYLALLMAMGDAELCLAGRVAFRTDSQTVVNLQSGTSGQYEGLRNRVTLLLARHPQWTLVLVEGKRNRNADALSRRAFRRGEDPGAGRPGCRSRGESDERRPT